MTKRCTKCGVDKPLTEFFKKPSAKSGLRSDCKVCAKAVVARWVRENRGRNLQARSDRRERNKLEVFDAYGGPKCTCCGYDSHLSGLVIDHVEGDGSTHRREAFPTSKNPTKEGNGARFYLWLKRNGFPEGFQVLCWTCNSVKHYNNGVCPH